MGSISSGIDEFVGVGRRKRAVASVRLRRGSGKIDVNGRSFEEYFPLINMQQCALAPVKKLGLEHTYDMIIRARGGGLSGQSGAVKLGLARALVKESEERRSIFKPSGFLRRDPRKRERKKYGQAGARKKFQYSKR